MSKTSITRSVTFSQKAFDNLESLRDDPFINGGEKLPRSKVLSRILEGNRDTIIALQHTAQDNKKEEI